jgi:hypothetical protein
VWKRVGLALLLALLCFTGHAAHAQTIHVAIGSTTITFPSASPAVTASIPAIENPIPVTFGYTGPGLGTWLISLTALGDLTGGAQTIPISSVRYSGTGSITGSGTLVKGIAVTVGSGSLTTPPSASSLSFFFANSWSYQPGVYTSSVLVTVVAL